MSGTPDPPTCNYRCETTNTEHMKSIHMYFCILPLQSLLRISNAWSHRIMSLSDYVEIATTKKITNPFSGSNMPFRLDVTFTLNTQETLELDTIVFQNYYVSSLTISQPVTPTSEFHHPILENKTLMRNPYTEDGAESWYSIHASEFDSYDKNRPLRFTLIQVCSSYRVYECVYWFFVVWLWVFVWLGVWVCVWVSIALWAWEWVWVCVCLCLWAWVWVWALILIFILQCVAWPNTDTYTHTKTLTPGHTHLYMLNTFKHT